MFERSLGKERAERIEGIEEIDSKERIEKQIGKEKIQKKGRPLVTVNKKRGQRQK